MEGDEFVQEARAGFLVQLDAIANRGIARMVAAGIPSDLAGSITQELVEGSGAAWWFLVTAAQDAGRDIREFHEGGE